MLAAKARDLIQEMEIIPVGRLLFCFILIQRRGAGRPNAGKGSLSGTGTEQTQLPHRPAGATASGGCSGAFSHKSLMAQVANFQAKVREPGGSAFFLKSWPVSIYITQLNPQGHEPGGRFCPLFSSPRHENLYFLPIPQASAVK